MITFVPTLVISHSSFDSYRKTLDKHTAIIVPIADNINRGGHLLAHPVLINASLQQAHRKVVSSRVGTRVVSAINHRVSIISEGGCIAPTGGLSPSATASKRKNVPSRPWRCPVGYKSCPVYGRDSGSGFLMAYECIDTQRDLESCGGCVNHDSTIGKNKGGRDCSAIPNVDAVRCYHGQCLIGE